MKETKEREEGENNSYVVNLQHSATVCTVQLPFVFTGKGSFPFKWT